MRFDPGSVLRYEHDGERGEWAVVLVLDDPATPSATQRCLCLDGTRRFTPVGAVASWNLSHLVARLSRIA